MDNVLCYAALQHKLVRAKTVFPGAKSVLIIEGVGKKKSKFL